MRIAIYQNLPSGGAKRAVYEWVKRLSARHSIDVYSLSSADHLFCDLRPWVNRYQIYDFSPRRLFRSPFGRLNALQRARDLSTLDSLHSLIGAEIDRSGCDLVLINPSLFTHVPPLAKYLKTPSVYYLHEPVGGAVPRTITRPYHDNSRPGSLRGKLDRIDPALRDYKQRLERMQLDNLHSTGLLLANSQYTQQQMRQTFGLQAEVCYLGVDSDFFSPLQGVERQDYVLSVGELTPRKGFDFLILSLGLIDAARRPALHLASNYEDAQEKAYLQQLASRWDVKLVLSGRLDNEQLRLEYNRAQLCLFAPLQEPFGLVPLEAMACGTPVIGVAEGGVSESIQDRYNGRLVTRTPAEFAGAVVELLQDSQRLAQYRRQARTSVLDSWRWEQAVERLEMYLTQSNLNERPYS